MYIYESETLMLMNLCVETRGPRMVATSKLTSRVLAPGPGNPGPGTRAPGRGPQSPGPRPRPQAPGPRPRALGLGPRDPGPGPWAPVPGPQAPSPGATTINFITLLDWTPTLMSSPHKCTYICMYIGIS